MDIGVVGHRNLDDRARTFTAHACAEILDCAPRRALSALAIGADTLFAQAALHHGVALHAFRPHDAYAGDFAADELPDYRRLSAAAEYETRLPFAVASDQAYRAAMRAIADASDMLVAVWDGVPSAEIGGTADTVQYARSRGQTLIVVDVTGETVVRDG